MSWYDQVRNLPLLSVARSLGYRVVEARNSNGGQIFGCPVPECRKERRHEKDKDPRGAIGLKSNGVGWRCHACKTGGGPIEFVAYHVDGQRKPGDRAAAWLKDFAGISEAPDKRWVYIPPIPPPPLKPPNYPPPEFIAELWASTRYVTNRKCWSDDEWRAEYSLFTTQVTDAELWLIGKRIDPVEVRRRDLARVCCREKTWGRLAVPMFDVHGEMRSIKYRAIDGSKIKSLSIKGFSTSGLHFGGALPKERGRLIVVEGEKKFLQHTLGQSHPVIGIVSGSWTDDHAERLPIGTLVDIRTDADAAGLGYATTIVRSLRDRVGAEEVRIALGEGLRLNPETTTVEAATT